jgi:hypothetical protein
MAHSTLVLEEWDRLMRIARQEGPQDVVVVIDGKSLDLATIVAVAR